jgi:ElaB/YqjD/DUF883 family membrane-anchored ribosome-binding protein
MAKSQSRKTSTTSGGYTNRIVDDVMSLASSLLRNRKDSGAEKLHTLAEATREYAASMTDLPNLREHVASASESIEGLSDYVMHTDVEHMVTDAGAFARRYPFATLGVTIAAGVVASRILLPTRVTPAAKSKPRASKRPVKQAARTRRGTNGHVQPNA